VFKDASEHWRIIQGCCNNWQCPRCGQIRARHEFARIALGATKLFDDGNLLFFVTVTCRGKELDLETAVADNLKWTNRLISSWRYRTKVQDETWAYVQITERQTRGAAHSHFICCSFPDDNVPYSENSMLPNGIVAKHGCLYSQWFIDRCVSAGL